MYPIWSTVSTELSWAHFQELIKIDRKEEREFYEIESIKSNWGCRELRRQICADKDDAVVEMTLGDDVKNVYTSKYLTYMPTKEELIRIIKDEKELIELAKENEKDNE